MKRNFVLSILVCFVSILFAQDRIQLFQQIDNARSFEDMPVIEITANRDHNYRIKKDDFNEVVNVKKGDVFTLYFPIFIEKNNIWKTVWYSYNYICLEPTMSTEALIVKRIIDLDLNEDDKQLYRKWLLKYENLGRIKLKEQDEI